MDQTVPKDAGKKPPEKVLLKNERVLLWGYLAEKCSVCGIHQPFEIYAFEPSFFKKEPMDVLARDVRPLADMGACPVYEPESNAGGHYLHICTFCGHFEVSDTSPKANVDVFWEPVDRIRILAETTVTDRGCFDEKRQVSLAGATKFFEDVRREKRFALGGGMTPLGIFLLIAVTVVSAYFGLRAAASLARSMHSPAIFSFATGAAGVAVMLLILWLLKWRHRHSLVGYMMIRLYPFSLELPILLEHAGKAPGARAVAKALKPLVGALDEAERTTT